MQSTVSLTPSIHYEDGNPARAYIKQALGTFKDGDGNTLYQQSVKASANSVIIFFFTSAQDGNKLLDDERLSLADDLKKAHDQNQNKLESRPVNVGRTKAEFDALIYDITNLETEELVDSNTYIWSLSHDDKFLVNSVRKHIDEHILASLSPRKRNVIATRCYNRPPMLEKSQYNTWQSRMKLYIRGKEHGKDILDSVLNGPFKYGTVEVPGTPTTAAYMRERTYEISLIK
ncbi:hypothetical protein Tco_1058409 [Tanacetum coccineum]|uniref:Uncharacterized protein n=1 Tax=Tanacetum coccineum TaxID=301880 RepID=A0ABQ5HA06_9ASTR